MKRHLYEKITFHVSMAIGLLGPSVAGFLWVFAAEPPDRVVLARGAIDLIAPFAVMALAAGLLLILRAKVNKVGALVGSLALLGALGLGLWYQRYTEFGVFLFNGDEYWVRRAASAETTTEKKACLQVAISGIEYTLNTTESEILENFSHEPRVQEELFLLLEEVVQLEHWKKTYHDRAMEAARRVADQPD